MASVHPLTTGRGWFLTLLMLAVGTSNPALSVRVGVVFLLAMAIALVGLLYLAIPIWTLSVFAVGLIVAVRLGVPLGLWAARVSRNSA